MTLNISRDNTNVIERGVYYFRLSGYPHIAMSDLKKIAAFIRYEKSYGRQTDIVCQDESVLMAVNEALLNYEPIENAGLPVENEFVYHATDIISAQQILSVGKLLSSEKVYKECNHRLFFTNQ